MSFKRKLTKVRIGIRRHKRAVESKRIQKAKLQRNKDLKEAQRLNESFKARAEAATAKAERAKANAPNVAARKQKIAKLEKQAKSALSGLKKAFVAMDKYANKKR